jgi:hypothetical protein
MGYMALLGAFSLDVVRYRAYEGGVAGDRPPTRS